jgi:hypothetical protein
MYLCRTATLNCYNGSLQINEKKWLQFPEENCSHFFQAELIFRQLDPGYLAVDISYC